MIGFNYIKRDYVNPVDLQTLNKSFDNLEAGHLKAVEAASELQNAVGMIKMNEAEDGFKQGLVDEIQQTIDENTIYGNASYAYDDLLRYKSILTRPDVLGRIKAQEEYQAFNDNLDKRTDISEGMKEMYREINPYYYEDKFDENGRVIGGSKWSANKKPVSTIDLYKLMSTARANLSAEKGGSETIVFLDKNGKETRKAEESVDGLMYKKIGTTYEELPEERILSAIQNAINATPGARESLIQDREYGMWYHNKHKDEEGYAPDPDMIDENGNFFGLDQFILNKTMPFARDTKIHNITTKVDWGTALQNYRNAQLIAAQASNDLETHDAGIGSNLIGMMNVQNNDFAALSNTKNKAEEAFVNTYASLINKKLTVNPTIGGIKAYYKKRGITINNTDDLMIAIENRYKSEHNGKEMDEAVRNALYGYLHAYSSAEEDMTTRIKSAGDYGDALKFSRDVAKGSFTGDNEYSKKIIELNNMYAHQGIFTFTIGKEVYANFRNTMGFTDIRELGLTAENNGDGDYIIKIDTNHSDMLPRFMKNLQDAYDITGGTIWSGISHPFKYLVGAINDNMFKVDFERTSGNTPDMPEKSSIAKTSGIYVSGTDDGERIFGLYVNTYNEGLENAAKAEDKVGVGNGLMSYYSTDANSIREIELRNDRTHGVLKPGEYNTLSTKAKKDLDDMFAANAVSLGQIYVLEDMTLKKDVTNALNYQNLIQTMYNMYPTHVKRSYVVADGIPNAYGGDIPTGGYYLSITVPANAKENALKDYKGQTIHLFVAGSIEEGTAYNPIFDTSNIAKNAVRTATATSTTKETIGFNPIFGDTNIKGVSTTECEVNFGGINKIVSSSDAELFYNAMINARWLKNNNMSLIAKAQKYGATQDDIDSQKRIFKSYEELAKTVAAIFELEPDVVYNAMLNYAQSE